jgi:hypothetical protein
MHRYVRACTYGNHLRAIVYPVYGTTKSLPSDAYASVLRTHAQRLIEYGATSTDNILQ